MYGFIELIIPKKDIGNLQFINETLTLKKDDYYMFVYFKPFDFYIRGFKVTDIIVFTLETFDITSEEAKGWQVVRDNSIANINDDVKKFLNYFHLKAFKNGRSGGSYMKLDKYLINVIHRGLVTYEDVFIFVVNLYLHGYGEREIIKLYSSLTHGTESLHKYFFNLLYDLNRKEQYDRS